ncbi:MAG: hypothetical protein RMK35_05480 [Aquificaceae bacterium]|nr:hypothetical protein [Aquificaceae bacterium]MDW8096161.1 hypothetical protein [Aquificaceae bacterium]MDW8434239.1 hypothetical protein [Aquificaceae bacterium]
MKRLLLLLPFILSMGEPVRDERLRVEVEDKSGVRHSMKGILCSGRAYLKLREGNVEYSVDFSSLRSLEVLSQEGQQIRVRLTFRGRSSKEYSLPSDLYCKGGSQIGEAGFYLRDVKTILFTVEER